MRKRLTFKKYLDVENTYYVKNKSGDKLGDIEYYKDWKCWIFQPEISTIFSDDCLLEIQGFLTRKNREQKG